MSEAPPVILLVEDNENDVMFLRRACAKAGLDARLQVASDGAEAVDYILGKPPFDDRPAYPAPTHMLLDLKLPRKSGLEVLAWLRETSAVRSLPVIVLTSSQEKSDVERARQLSVEDFFVKPISLPDLVDVVRRIARAWGLPLGKRGA